MLRSASTTLDHFDSKLVEAVDSKTVAACLDAQKSWSWTHDK